MSEIKEIKITLAEGSELVFNPKEHGIIKVMKGVEESSIDGFSERSYNGKEVLIIVCGPQEVRRLFNDDGDIHFWIEQKINET